MRIAKVVHSVVSSTYLADELRKHYELDEPIRCELHLRGINDTYCITTSSGKRFALKLTRVDWRTERNLIYELAVLEYLSRHLDFVPKPVKTASSRTHLVLEAPEGRRFGALCSWLDGRNQRTWPSEIGSRRFGEQLGVLHRKVRAFPGSADQDLDIVADLVGHASHLQDVLSSRSTDQKFVSTALVRVVEELGSIGKRLESGVCHGDVHPGNAVLDADRKLGILDFDVCGNWYQCFDVASFLWSVELFGWGEEHAHAFLEGYSETNCLSDEEVKLLPLLKLARDSWHLVTWARNRHALGCPWFHDYTIDQRMTLFRKLSDDI